MTFVAQNQVLETRFGDNWTYTPIEWPNVKLSTAELTEYVAFDDVSDDKNESSIGSDPVLYRTEGMVVVRIFVKPNSGATRAIQLADLVADIWRSASFSGYTMKAPRLVKRGVVDGWYQVNVISPYFRHSYESRSVL